MEEMGDLLANDLWKSSTHLLYEIFQKYGQHTHSEVIKFRYHWQSPANRVEESSHLTHVGKWLNSHHLKKKKKKEKEISIS